MYRIDNKPVDYDNLPSSIELRGGYVNSKFDKLKHGQEGEVDKYFVYFKKGEPIKSFSIEYSLVIANYPSGIRDKLQVLIE